MIFLGEGAGVVKLRIRDSGKFHPPPKIKRGCWSGQTGSP